MPNLDKIQKEIDRIVNSLMKNTEKDIAKQYAKTLQAIRKELSTMYEKYEQGGVLTYAEMAKYDRLTRFLREIEHLLGDNYKTLRKLLYDLLSKIYLEAYYLTGWAVETDTLSKLNYSDIIQDAILEVIEDPISGLKLPQRLEKNRINIVYTVQQEITQGLVKGETYSSMAKRIKRALEGDTAKAIRIARTEAHRVVEAGKLDSALHASKHGVVMLKEWNSVEDERVRHSAHANHRKLNGVKIPVEQNFKQGDGEGPGPGRMGSAAHDINCRCFLTYSVERIDKPVAKELENMSFEEWKRTRLKK